MLLYSALIWFYTQAIRTAALWNSKARLWVRGRKDWQKSLTNQLQGRKGWIWLHAASLGEFEQGREIIEAIRRHHPELPLLVTFFSPSGYEIRKNYAGAEVVCYLPADTAAHARQFLDLVQPALVFWVKYDFWLHFLRELASRNIPTLLIAARPTTNNFYLSGPVKQLFAQGFKAFRAVFTQDEASKVLWQKAFPEQVVEAAGDPRFDRVSATRDRFSELPDIAAFCKGRKVLVAGSTWPVCEHMIREAWPELSQDPSFALIIVPHEIHPDAIDAAVNALPEVSARYTAGFGPHHRILWVDTIGMLSRIYHYADICYVGGGWGSGLHNILEPAVFGKPVLFGPRHRRFPEADALITAGGGLEIGVKEAFGPIVADLLRSPEMREGVGACAKRFVDSKTGATQRILSWTYQQKLLPVNPPTANRA